MNEAGSVNHFTDDGDFPLLSDDVSINANTEVVVDCMTQSHGNHWTDSFAMAIKVVP